MSVANQKEIQADLGEIAEAGTHLPEPTDTPSNLAPEEDHEHGFELVEVLRVAFVALAAAAVWFHLWEPFHRVSVIGLGATLVGGYPIFKEAFENILERRMTMELSMTIALVSALAIGEFFTALVITAFVLAAEILEGLTVGRGRRAIQDMLDFLPQTASVLRQGRIAEVDTKAIQPGEVVVIRPGSKIPVDGRVLSGHSFVEQAAITGEAMPSEKSAGSDVYAGTINQAGTLQVRAERLGKETTFGKIIEAVENAERSRAPIQKTADRLAGYLVYFALGAAVLTFLITHNLRSTISVIIVAGACGIAAGTPLAILGAIGRAARHGSIIKGGVYLEQLAKIDTVLLDKTGTLTSGKPHVALIEPAYGYGADDLLRTAAAAERNSEHPLALAVVAAAQEKQLVTDEPSSFSYTPGKGVRATVVGRAVVVGNVALLEDANVSLPAMGTTAGARVLVARDGQFIGSIHIADQVRDGAAEAIRELQNMGLQIELLTGDTEASAVAVGKSIGIHQISSGLLPEQKSARVDELIRLGRTVAMIGDGINDAPALSHAHVGVAMGSGTEIAHASAN